MLGSRMGTTLEGGLRAFTGLRLGRNLSPSAGSGCSSPSKVAVGMPALVCCILQSDAGSSCPGKRLPPVGCAA